MMYGNATLEIPGSGDIEPSRYLGLSDELALVLGRFAARTLSEEDGYVRITYSSGQVKLIGHDTANNRLVFGQLVEYVL